MSVKVGVRVRPFNKREQQLDCKCCVEMIGTTTHIHSADRNDTKTFVFDYSFWSHDKFVIDADGVYQPVDDKYADQTRVYNQIGADILVNAWEGYNCCLFAYGQTGSGKSYSMLGYGINRGIIPMVCDNIFEKIKEDKDKSHSYEVKISMMEIYNQTLRDLLTKSKKHTQLKICQTKKLGVYVEGLVKHPVHSYQQIHKKIEQGSNNRSIAATLMNESSSRSHTIVSITFVKKVQVTAAQTSVKFSTIHLVDLAGSQSVGKTGVDSKDRLREAAKINQSLSTLGRVIQILAQNASKTQKIFVPYRDSKLTFILRNALGGNSRTAMICAISPADDNYQQTLSTLRYANRAKKIQNKAMVNESDVDKLIRMLRQQNQMLKKMLKQAKFNKTVINNTTQVIQNIIMSSDPSNDADLLLDSDQLLPQTPDTSISQQQQNPSSSDILNLQLKQQQSQSNPLNQSNISSLMLDYDGKIDQKQPYITNLSQDQLLSGRLKYSCAKLLRIGNKSGIPRPDVVLAALGICGLHCQIRNQNGDIYMQICDEQASQYTFVNGYNVQKDHPIKLMNYDRLIFGTGCVFLVRIPNLPQIRKIKKDGQQKQLKSQDIDYTFAIQQMQEHHLAAGLTDKNHKVSQAQQQQIRKKVLGEIQAQYDKMKDQNQQQMKNRLILQEKAYQQKITEIQKIRKQQALRMKQQLEKKSAQAHKLKADKQKIQQQIVHFKQLQRKLEQSSIDKQALQQARKALQQKMAKINQMENSLLSISEKQAEMIQQMQKKQVIIQKQLEYKMVMCNNQNILNQYKLELSKKTKNLGQLKELLIKKQRIQMQKQLIQLVPMIQKFNLIAKQMQKPIECGLSIDYTYISEGEVLQILKNNLYKNKVKISIHVHNKEESRSYFWGVDVFKNRYQLAISLFELFIRNQKDPKLNNKQSDPYWDPPTLQMIGVTFLSLQFLFYKFDFQGDLVIVKKGTKIGTVHVKIFPTDPKRPINLAQQTYSGITIHSPRDFIQKTLYFTIQLSCLTLQKPNLYNKIQFQYILPQNSYKNQTIQTPLQIPTQFAYNNTHVLADLSETVIMQYVDTPLGIRVYAEMKECIQRGSQFDVQDDLTSRGDDSFIGSIPQIQGIDNNQSEKRSTNMSSFSSATKSQSKNPLTSSFTLPTKSNTEKKQTPTSTNGHSGIMVSNFDVMSKIQAEYNKKMMEDQKNNKDKDKDKNKGKKDKNKGKDQGKDAGKKGKDQCATF